jgi:hypothetical protein
MKLFIILMSLSTLGFGIAAYVLYRLERKYEEALRVEKRAFDMLQQEVHNPENEQYQGKAKTGVVTTGRELPEYLSRCARLAGIADDTIKGAQNKTDPKGGYSETTYILKGIAFSDLLRFLALVEGDKDDVYLKTLHLLTFDYTKGDVPTCGATAVFYVSSEKE